MEHELVIEKLKGHTYSMSLWQYAEAKHHVDPEFNYKVYETVYRFHKESQSSGYQLVQLLVIVARVFICIMLEREKIDALHSPVEINRVIRVMLNAYENYKGVKPESMFDIANLLSIYAVADILVQIRFYK